MRDQPREAILEAERLRAGGAPIGFLEAFARAVRIAKRNVGERKP